MGKFLVLHNIIKRQELYSFDYAVILEDRDVVATEIPPDSLTNISIRVLVRLSEKVLKVIMVY
jgi:hypothetical protein